MPHCVAKPLGSLDFCALQVFAALTLFLVSAFEAALAFEDTHLP